MSSLAEAAERLEDTGNGEWPSDPGKEFDAKVLFIREFQEAVPENSWVDFEWTAAASSVEHANADSCLLKSTPGPGKTLSSNRDLVSPTLTAHRSPLVPPSEMRCFEKIVQSRNPNKTNRPSATRLSCYCQCSRDFEKFMELRLDRAPMSSMSLLCHRILAKSRSID